MRKYLVAIVIVVAACKGGSGSSEPKPEQPQPKPDKVQSLVVDLAGYDRSCTVDADCIGADNIACDKCGCPQQAISAKEKLRLNAEVQKIDCTKQPPDTRRCGECMSPEFHCVSNVCTP